MAKIAVVLINWNGRDLTLACLRTLVKMQMKGHVVSTYVVDNASSDDSVAAIGRAFPEVRLLIQTSNVGFTGGNNIGIRQALMDGADYVWLLNNDTEVDKNAGAALVSAFRDKKIGIAGSKIYFAKGHEYHKERYAPSETGKVLWYAGGLIDWDNMYGSHLGVDEVDHGQYDKHSSTDFITGCSMMVARNVFETIGFFDERFFLYLEDLDLSLRAKKAGFSLVFVPGSVVWHKNAGSSGSGSLLHQYYMTRNRILVAGRYASVRTKLAIFRESIRFLVDGPAVKRRAVIDAWIGRYGPQTL